MSREDTLSDSDEIKEMTPADYAEFCAAILSAAADALAEKRDESGRHEHRVMMPHKVITIAKVGALSELEEWPIWHQSASAKEVRALLEHVRMLAAEEYPGVAEKRLRAAARRKWAKMKDERGEGDV